MSNLGVIRHGSVESGFSQYHSLRRPVVQQRVKFQHNWALSGWVIDEAHVRLRPRHHEYACVYILVGRKRDGGKVRLSLSLPTDRQLLSNGDAGKWHWQVTTVNWRWRISSVPRYLTSAAPARHYCYSALHARHATRRSLPSFTLFAVYWTGAWQMPER